jgi:hypothetical protein
VPETLAAITIEQPEKHAEKEKRHDEQEKDQYASQKTSHDKTSFARWNAATRSRGSSAEFHNRRGQQEKTKPRG